MSAPLCCNCYTRPDDHRDNKCPVNGGLYVAMTAQEFEDFGVSKLPGNAKMTPQHELLAFMVKLNFGSKQDVVERVDNAILCGDLEKELEAELREYQRAAGGRWLSCAPEFATPSPIFGLGNIRFVPD